MCLAQNKKSETMITLHLNSLLLFLIVFPCECTSITGQDDTYQSSSFLISKGNLNSIIVCIIVKPELIDVGHNTNFLLSENAKESITIKEFNHEKVCGVFDVRKNLQAFT